MLPFSLLMIYCSSQTNFAWAMARESDQPPKTAMSVLLVPKEEIQKQNHYYVLLNIDQITKDEKDLFSYYHIVRNSFGWN